MTDQPYDIGDKPTLSYTFLNAAGAAADPTVVTLKLRTPAGVETSHVHGTDVNVVKDSVGVYHYELPLAESGLYTWRWIGTGALVCADEGTIPVRASRFTNP